MYACILDPSVTVLQRFPNIVHFIYVDRKVNLMIAPSPSGGNKTHTLKKKVFTFIFLFFFKLWQQQQQKHNIPS